MSVNTSGIFLHSISMKRHFIFLILLFATGSVLAQQTVSGTVRDATTGEGLVGAIVIVNDGINHAVADLDGNYKLTLADGNYLLKVKYTGYDADSVNIKIAGKDIVQDFNCISTTLKEVEIVADVAIDRKTPVAFSNINENKIREEGGGRDMTMLLNSTPGAYASEQGGGSGDSRVNIRGVDQRNVGVMVDGIPMNDMENGQVYWSNWDGLADVTRTMQVQRGLGASKLAIPSVGGTINVLTRGIYQKRSFSVRTEFGNNNMQKLSFGFNSGEIKKGWGITVAGSRKTGNGWADQTWDDQWSYFAKIQKRYKNNLFSLGVNGAPQSHSQRYDRMTIGVYDKEYARKLISADPNREPGTNFDSLTNANMLTGGYTTLTQGERGLRYNPNWGYLAYGDNKKGMLSQDVNFYSKPLFNLSWYFTPNEKFSISTITYLSVGNGGGTNYNSSINRDSTSGQLNWTSAYNSNSTSIDALYSPTEHKASRIILASMNNHIWYGGLSTATYKPNDHLSFLLGLDVRHYKGSHYRKIYDLVGGDYYIDNSDKNQPNGVGNLGYSMKRKDDKVSYWNDSYVDWQGLFTQAEYSQKNWSAFLTLSGSYSEYQRVDHFRKKDLVLPDTTIAMIVGYNETYYTNGIQSAVAQNGAIITNSGDTTIIDNPSGPTYYIPNAVGYSSSSPEARTAQTEKKTFPGFTFKTGINYNIGEHYHVFTNVGYLQMAPRFNTVFDNYNKEFPNPKNQKVAAVELGAGAQFGKWAANLNLYLTNWINKPPSFSPTITTPDGTFTYDLQNLDSRMMGIEFDGKFKPIKQIQVDAFASFGDWKNTSAGTVLLYDQNYVLSDTITYSAKNIHIGDAAQTQLGGSCRWEPLKGFYLTTRYTYFARHYANFDPIALTKLMNANGTVYSDNRDRESWKMPSYGLLDFYGGYEIREEFAKEKTKVVYITFGIAVNNVLNTVYISDGQNGSDFSAATALVYMGMGRRWTASMRFSF